MADVHVASDLQDAVKFLAAHGPTALPVAGGTDVLVDTRLGRVAPEWLVDLSRVGGLDGIHLDGEHCELGALTRIRALERHAELADRAPALVEAARVLGSVQIRAMATVGGNLCHATPSAELPPPLLVHGAVAAMVGPGGTRDVVLGELFAGPGLTTLQPSELLASVTFDVPAAGWGSCYLRQTVRWAMDLAGVGVAAGVGATDRVVHTATVALGAVSPTPMLLDVGDLLAGGAPGQEALREAGRRAAAACSPISDARGTADYRRTVVAALVPRALRIAWLRAAGEWPAGTLAPINGVLAA